MGPTGRMLMASIAGIAGIASIASAGIAGIVGIASAVLPALPVPVLPVLPAPCSLSQLSFSTQLLKAASFYRCLRAVDSLNCKLC